MNQKPSRWAFALRFFLSLVLIVELSAVPARADWYKVGEGDSLFVDFPLQSNLQDLQPLAGNGLSLVAVGNLIYWRYQVTVAPDGYITLPSLDPIQVAGSTLAEVRKLIISKLKSTPRNALVSVSLAKSDSSAFFVWGEVKQPGRFAFQRPTSFMDAVGMAGGTTDQAKLDRVILLRASDPPITIDLTPKYLAKAGPPFLALRPSDTIYVPRKLWGSSAFTTGLFLLISIVTAGATVAIASKS